ncbi:MAG: hypothetical protein EBR88_00065 [Betaproteobacteria bacterium]|nr:hypothetical protein [Betaproteobacteria bacterium]
MTTPRQLLGQARVHTFDYVPYLASYIYSLREHETPGIETACVDEHGNLYWDPAFVVECGKEQTAYLVAHEALHLVYEHSVRAKEIIGSQPDELQKLVCNIAADLVIEQTLSMMRHLRPEGAVYLGCMLPELDNIILDFPENLSMQSYYRLIMDKLRQPPSPDSHPQGDSDADGNNSAGGSTGSNDDRQGENDTDSGDSGHRGSSGMGDGEDSGNATHDGMGSDNMDGSAGQREGSTPPRARSDAKGAGRPGMGGSCADGQPRPYEVENDGSWDAFGSDMAAQLAMPAVEAYVQQHGAGSVPGNLREHIRNKLVPQPDPFDQLRSLVCSAVASPVGGRDYSHRRRSRKQPPGDDVPLLHGRITTMCKAVVIVDTSGSMTSRPLQARAMSVIAQGLQKYGRIKVYCADTVLRSHATVSCIDRFEWHGGGGTDMAAAMASVDKQDKPDAIVLVTDAITEWPAVPTRARSVVAYIGSVHSPHYRRIPKWCRKVALSSKGG